ncbi:MAG: hypothetical protein NTW03_04935, partial [Verrucomicrobia bacterium]|nr:hypothetical protein [Verrucomicrobiota bacterium]
MTTIDRARSYLAKMPPAISGQGGHAATFNAACRLVEFGLGFETALPLLAEWNQSHCQPQWTDKELGHKLTDAFKRTKPSTKFASAPEQRLSVAARPAFTRQPASPGIADKVRPLDAATGAPSGNLSSEPINRPAPWKLSLRAGEPEEHAALARLRGLSVEAIALASERGLLRFGSWSRLSAWFIVDKSNRV